MSYHPSFAANMVKVARSPHGTFCRRLPGGQKPQQTLPVFDLNPLGQVVYTPVFYYLYCALISTKLNQRRCLVLLKLSPAWSFPPNSKSPFLGQSSRFESRICWGHEITKASYKSLTYVLHFPGKALYFVLYLEASTPTNLSSALTRSRIRM